MTKKVMKKTAIKKGASNPVERIMRDIDSLVRLEPTCIRCECTEYDPCPEGCGWVFVNSRNEGICTACLSQWAKNRR